MRNNDARLLTPSAQETLRRRAVAVINDGMSQTDAAKVFGVSRSSIAKWVKYFREGGERALTIKKRGRPSGKRLASWQSAQVVRTIIDHCPDQVKLPWALWTCAAVGQYIKNHFGIVLSQSTVRRYLKDWDLSPQKAARPGARRVRLQLSPAQASVSALI